MATGMFLSYPPMVRLLMTMLVIGISARTAVSISVPVWPNARSPMKFMQNLSGLAIFEPIASGMPYPRCVVLPQPMYPCGTVAL